MVISCSSYPSSGSSKRSVSLTQIPFTAQSNKTSWAVEQWPRCTTQEHALCDGLIRAAAHSDWNHISGFRARGGSLTNKIPWGRDGYRVSLCSHRFNGFLCLDKPTSKSTSGRQLHPQKGPWIFRTGSLCSFATRNFGENGCHCCAMYPTMLPGGDCTSSWVGDCGRTECDLSPYPHKKLCFKRNM